MTHYPVVVAGPRPEKALRPFDEDLYVEPYIVEGADWASSLAAGKNYLQHQIENETLSAKQRQTCRDILAMNDLDLLKATTGDNWQARVGEEGYDRWATANPDGYWDWYVLGGRWTHELFAKNSIEGVNQLTAEQLDVENPRSITPVAYIDLDGTWHAQGTVGWFGNISEGVTEEEWIAQYRAWIAALPGDTQLRLYDLHK